MKGNGARCVSKGERLTIARERRREGKGRKRKARRSGKEGSDPFYTPRWQQES
jgi:hypothetical protein